MMIRYKAIIGIAAVTAIGLSGCGVSLNNGVKTTSQPSLSVPRTPGGQAPLGSEAQSLQTTFNAVFKKVEPSVVEVTTNLGLGSGVIINSAGYIATNYHVVSGASTVSVTLSSGKTLTATVVGTFAPDDLAVIHINETNLPAAVMADSSKLQVGDLVMAIGNPLGLNGSVTEGIVSAVGRTVSEGTGNAVLPDAIQTSAAINPGNSGGALVDMSGDVVGIPTLTALDQQYGGTAPGIGFAIPSNIVNTIANQIIQSGHVTSSGRAYLGIEASDFPGGGVYVRSVVAGSPAEKAGIQSGEVITSLDNQTVDNLATLEQILATLQPGAQVPVKVRDTTNGTTSSVTVTLSQLSG